MGLVQSANRTIEGEVEETTQQKENIRVITGFIDDEKLELLSRCALGLCRKPQQIMDLANEFHRADLVGFKIMRVAGSLVLLIFQSLEERKRMLESAVLDTWLENVMEWSPTIAMPNRRNLAALWGELVKVGDRTLDPLNFETAHFLVKTDWFYRIEEIVDLLWEDNMMEDWRVLELPNAESGEAPGSGQVGEVGNAMIMAEVGEPGLEIPIEVLGPSERSMELIDVGPQSEVPRAGKVVTIELNGEQRRIRQLSEINLSILSLVERF
ncbi:hypothetical protein V6N11_009732 [Hibiscus sabdariffa]|uniref:DUF4283 domain-containing protein n=1 Tax=Hibiscus sabdariffa TaxID=183260 RepID=A0ABR2P6A0_9ROSI